MEACCDVDSVEGCWQIQGDQHGSIVGFGLVEAGAISVADDAEDCQCGPAFPEAMLVLSQLDVVGEVRW